MIPLKRERYFNSHFCPAFLSEVTARKRSELLDAGQANIERGTER
jgi:hypothetical protein